MILVSVHCSINFSDSAIILKKVDKKNLFNEIEKLINNKKLLLSVQKRNYNNFFLTHNYVSGLIDNIRSQYLDKF